MYFFCKCKMESIGSIDGFWSCCRCHLYINIVTRHRLYLNDAVSSLRFPISDPQQIYIIKPVLRSRSILVRLRLQLRHSSDHFPRVRYSKKISTIIMVSSNFHAFERQLLRCNSTSDLSMKKIGLFVTFFYEFIYPEPGQKNFCSCSKIMLPLSNT
jgi:hypothetical protein